MYGGNRQQYEYIFAAAGLAFVLGVHVFGWWLEWMGWGATPWMGP